MSVSFRHSAGLGKRMEYYIIGLMLKEGIDVYVPLVDDNAIDAVIRKSNGTFCEIQIKARSSDVEFKSAALFAAIPHKPRENYYFVFYSARLNHIWVLSSEEYLSECRTNKSGNNIGKTTLKFNGAKTDRLTKQSLEYPLERFKKYITSDFSQFK